MQNTRRRHCCATLDDVDVQRMVSPQSTFVDVKCIERVLHM